MKQVDPKVLKHLRRKNRWSQEELAQRAKIGKRRLIELEKETGEFHEMRDGNFADLCKALNATPGQLSGEEAITEALPANYVTLRSKITTVAQMNYDLIATQYGVESDRLVQLAPLMFAILVEDSFQWRAGQLELLRHLRELEDKLRETVYTKKTNGPYEFSISDIINNEEMGIQMREPFTVPLEAANALFRNNEVVEGGSFESFEELREHRITDRFTDFISEKIRSATYALQADIPDISPSSVRNILDYEIRYVSDYNLFEYVTEGDDEQATALYRLALLTGAVRLRDADQEKITGRTELKAWFAEQLRNPDVISRLAEVAPAVSRRELRGPDEEKGLGLDDFGFPLIFESHPEFKRRNSKDAPANEKSLNDEGANENAPA
jgi:transcriptional regulator with XRE-family HTH domain